MNADDVTIKNEASDVVNSDISQDKNITVKMEKPDNQLSYFIEVDISPHVKSEPADVDDVCSSEVACGVEQVYVAGSPGAATTTKQEMDIKPVELQPAGSYCNMLPPCKTEQEEEKLLRNCPEERIEAAQFSDEYATVRLVSRMRSHLERWLKDLPSATGHSPEDPPELDTVPMEEQSPSSSGQTAEMAAVGFRTRPFKRAATPDAGPSGVQRARASVLLDEHSVDGSELDSEFDDLFDDPDPLSVVPEGRELPPSEELDEDVAALLAKAEEAMDSVQSDLPDISFDFDWTDDFSSFRGTRGTFTGGPTGPTMLFDAPYDAFVAIWDYDIMQRIADETNRYAWQTIIEKTEKGGITDESRLHSWRETDVDELYVLFAMFIVMEYTPRFRVDDYWKTTWSFNNPDIRSAMSYNRFILLSKFLHFVDQYGEDRCDQPKLAKLMPIIDHCNTKFQQLYVLGEHLTIDESLTLWKGQLSWAQCIRTNTARFGIKSYELCESSTGYVWRFVIYTAKESGQSPSFEIIEIAEKTTQIVLNLLQGLEFKGYCLAMDNFYNSPALTRYLKTRGFDCVGTLRVDRKNVPDAIKLEKSVPKGTIVARHCGDVSVLSWKDTKIVSAISTCHDAGTYVAHRRVKGPRHPVPYLKPIVFQDYYKYMGDVDLKDQKLSMYLLERRRGLKWYMNMFKRLLSVSIHNAFILHRRSSELQGRKPLTHRMFREQLADAIKLKHLKHEAPPCEPVDSLIEVRLRKDLLHTPKLLLSTERKRCTVCAANKQRKAVRIVCLTCNKGLCVPACWEKYHSLRDIRI